MEDCSLFRRALIHSIYDFGQYSFTLSWSLAYGTYIRFLPGWKSSVQYVALPKQLVNQFKQQEKCSIITNDSDGAKQDFVKS